LPSTSLSYAHILGDVGPVAALVIISLLSE
jgi:hypothetical protein